MGQRISEARRRSGLTQEQLAEAISLDRSSLAKVETGARRVSALELARIASALDARIEWFFEDAAPSVVSHRYSSADSPDTQIDSLIERVTREVEFVIRNTNISLGQLEPFDRPGNVTQIESAAQQVRELIGVNDTEPIHDLPAHLSGIGLLPFCLPLPPGTADAATVLLPAGAVSIVNGNLWVGRRRLSLAHELGHYLFADDYMVDWHIGERNDPDSWESRIDRFARAVLLPQIALKQMWHDYSAKGDSVRTAVVRIASLYRVDMSTLSRRLTELSLITNDEGNRIRQVRTKRADIIELDLVPSDEFAAPYLPRGYEQAVLWLYRQEMISADRAIELMFGTLDEESLPDLPTLAEDAIWQFVS
jgi:Zn-dependent peptidase ImmA (M78 family)/transcriptional regulator with XRE-family HTH domain